MPCDCLNNSSQQYGNTLPKDETKQLLALELVTCRLRAGCLHQHLVTRLPHELKVLKASLSMRVKLIGVGDAGLRPVVDCDCDSMLGEKQQQNQTCLIHDRSIAGLVQHRMRVLGAIDNRPLGVLPAGGQ